LNVLDLLKHLLSFSAPALAVALLVALAGRWLTGKSGQRPGWAVSFAINFVAGLAVLAAGLWYFGRDGKMATYLAMVAVVATCQWLSGRAWRS
jgi:multisubunit Na+/H+ antiporter MnhB subunit